MQASSRLSISVVLQVFTRLWQAAKRTSTPRCADLQERRSSKRLLVLPPEFWAGDQLILRVTAVCHSSRRMCISTSGVNTVNRVCVHTTVHHRSIIDMDCRCGSRKRRAITSCMFNATERCTPVAPFNPACARCNDPEQPAVLLRPIAPLPSAFPPQVVTFGPLGVLGRNGWFCREADVHRWNALAGYRGLRDPQVRRHFNGTFLAFERSWGDQELRMTNLDLRCARARRRIPRGG